MRTLSFHAAPELKQTSHDVDGNVHKQRPRTALSLVPTETPRLNSLKDTSTNTAHLLLVALSLSQRCLSRQVERLGTSPALALNVARSTNGRRPVARFCSPEPKGQTAAEVFGQTVREDDRDLNSSTSRCVPNKSAAHSECESNKPMLPLLEAKCCLGCRV